MRQVSVLLAQYIFVWYIFDILPQAGTFAGAS